MTRDTFTTTVADAADHAYGEEPPAGPELTWNEAREQMDLAPTNRCACGAPLAKHDGGTLTTCWGCST